MRTHSAIAVLLLALACQAPTTGSSAGQAGSSSSGLEVLPDLEVSRAPFHSVEVDWKHRLAQPYVFVEGRGSYTGIGALLETLHARLLEAELVPSGPPFALYYDDPGLVPVEELRMRACFPVENTRTATRELGFEVLASTTVVYAYVGGPYPEVPRAYPGLYAFMGRLGWVENGPIREIYLVNPAAVDDFEQLVCEVQIPATSGG
jgi:effector-binding domain-containing protein